MEQPTITTRHGCTSGGQTSGGPMQTILNLIEAIRIAIALINFWVI